MAPRRRGILKSQSKIRPFSYSRGRKAINTNVPKTRPPSSASARTKTIIPRGLPVADCCRCTLTYNDVFHWNHSGGLAVAQVMNANNIWDVDRSGIGHQPYLTDQYFSFYHRVLVVGCSYVAQFLNDDTAALTDVSAVFTTAQLSAGVQPRVIREIPYSKVKTVGVKQSGKGSAWLSDGISMNKLMGVQNIHPGNNDYTHDDGGGPAQDAFLEFAVQALDQVSTVNMYANIKVCYQCIFFDRKTANQS